MLAHVIVGQSPHLYEPIWSSSCCCYLEWHNYFTIIPSAKGNVWDTVLWRHRSKLFSFVYRRHLIMTRVQTTLVDNIWHRIFRQVEAPCLFPFDRINFAPRPVFLFIFFNFKKCFHSLGQLKRSLHIKLKCNKPYWIINEAQWFQLSSPATHGRCNRIALGVSYEPVMSAYDTSVFVHVTFNWGGWFFCNRRRNLAESLLHAFGLHIQLGGIFTCGLMDAAASQRCRFPCVLNQRIAVRLITNASSVLHRVLQHGDWPWSIIAKTAF